jgi:hypothetical protein
MGYGIACPSGVEGGVLGLGDGNGHGSCGSGSTSTMPYYTGEGEKKNKEKKIHGVYFIVDHIVLCSTVSRCPIL